MVPGLQVAEAEPQADATALLKLSRWSLRYSPLVAPDAPDGLWIDATGCAHLHGGEATLLADISARLQHLGFSARAAIAETPGAAHALARFAAEPQTVLQPGSTAKTLGGLPVACLRLDADILAGLRRVGLDRVAQLIAAPRAPLARRFGDPLLRRLDQALGRVFEPIAPILPPEKLAHRLAFAEPLLTAENFAAVIDVLTAAVCGKLERAGQGARRLDLLFERVDGCWQAIRIGTSRPTRAPSHLARLLREKLETIDPGLGVEAMHLVVTLAEKLGWTQQVTGIASDYPGVAELVDRLAGRLGPAKVFRAGPVESVIPERSVRRVGPLAPAGRVRWPLALPRPVRLIDPPQPVDVLALLPDHPPVAFTWRRVRHRVRRADGPERVLGEWWRRDAETTAVRDYFAVEDEAGRRFWLYRRGDGLDQVTGDLRWFLHGLF
jgi:protein ImuB